MTKAQGKDNTFLTTVMKTNATDELISPCSLLNCDQPRTKTKGCCLSLHKIPTESLSHQPSMSFVLNLVAVQLFVYYVF